MRSIKDCTCKPEEELVEADWHGCPYQAEINANNNPKFCACCDACYQECVWDI